MDRNQTSQSGSSSWTDVRPGPNVELIRDLNESLIAKYIENDRSNGLERATHTQISNAVKVKVFKIINILFAMNTYSYLKPLVRPQ